MTQRASREPDSHIYLWNRLRVSSTLHAAAAIRISDPDAREDLRNLTRSLGRMAEGSAVGVALAALGPNITEATEDGERDRAKVGLAPVHLCDLDARAPQRLLAYVGEVHGVLVMLVPSTAIDADLPPFEGDRIGIGRNGATELIREAVVRLPGLATLAAPRLDRLLRNVRFQGELLDDLRRSDVTLWTDSGVRDLSVSSEMTMTSLEGSMKGDADAVARKANFLAGRINALEPEAGGFSRRDFNWQQCPLGYRPQWREVDGLHVPVKGSIAVDTSATPIVQALWQDCAAGLTYREIGEHLAALGMRVRDSSGRTLGDMTSRERITVVARLVRPETARLHQTGEWVKQRSTSAFIHQAGGRQLERRADGRRGTTVKGRLPVPEIEGLPWGIDDATWTAVNSRLERSRRATPGDRARLYGSTPFSITSPVPVADVWLRLVPEHTTIQVRSHPAAQGGGKPAWDPADSSLVASCNARIALNLLGEELMRRLVLAGSGAQTVRLVPGTEAAAVRTCRVELAAAKDELAHAEQAAVVASGLAAIAQADGSFQAAAAQLAAQELELKRATSATEKVAAAATALEEARAHGADQRADLGTPLGVAAAMMRWDGGPNVELRRAMSKLNIAKSLRPRYDPATAVIEVRGTATLPRLDGSRVTLELHTTWPCTSRDRDLSRDAAQVVRTWAESADVSVAAHALGRKVGWVERVLLSWLGEHGIKGMRRALLDCPDPATVQCIVSALDPALASTPADLAPATIELIRAGFGNDRGRWKSWAGCAHAANRMLIQALELAGGEADVAALKASTGADPARMARPFGGLPAISHAPTDARRRLIACPHADCPSRWASHVLYVPATAEFGVLCRTCRRLPDERYAQAPLPASYLQNWDRVHRGSKYVTEASAPAQLLDEALAAKMGDLVRPAAVAEILGVTIGTVGDLRRSGRLTGAVDCAGVSLWHGSEIRALRTKRARRRGQSSTDSTWLSIPEVARILGVADHRARAYCDEGRLAYKRVGRGAYNRRVVHRDVVAAFATPEGDLLSSLTVAEAARRADLPDWTLRVAVRKGELETVQGSDERRMLRPEHLDAWLRLRQSRLGATPTAEVGSAGAVGAEGRLSVSAAAAILGISAKRVRALSGQGVLNDHRTDCRSWRWFDRNEIEAFRVGS